MDSKHIAVLAWLTQCPHITNLGFNFLSVEDGATAIVPTDSLVTEYLDGSQERRYGFDLVRFLPLGFNDEDVPANVDMQEEMDALAAWVDAQSDMGNLPVFNGCVVSSAAVLDTSSPYVAAADANLAKFIIPFAIDYMIIGG